MTEREAFEAWASDNNEWPQCIERSGDSYKLMQTKLKWEAWQAARAQTAQAVPLHQILTDPENQPNQYGIEFLMHGPKLAFKVGTQQFTLDYEPTEPGEFEYMRDMLIHAFSTFTPDVKTAQAVPLLTKQEMVTLWGPRSDGPDNHEIISFARAAEQAVRAKLGAAVPMTEVEKKASKWDAINAVWLHKDAKLEDLVAAILRQRIEDAERHHGIVGKEGA